MKLLSAILLSFILLFSLQKGGENIRRTNQPTLDSEVVRIVPQLINFNDTLKNNTLLIHFDQNNYPVKYSRKIVTGVCIKGECRLLNIELFWNITGRYLGFELPEGEFLSKTEHVKFSALEYDRLHYLLADKNSPLATYSLDELVPKVDTTKTGIDAISSATISSVMDYVVEGAVYTTYTLWHIVYGVTKREIEKLTSSKLNSELVLLLLESNNYDDQIWVLNHFTNSIQLTPELENKLLELISGSNIYLSEQALNAITPEFLTTKFQNELIKIYYDKGFLLKRLILGTLKKATGLSYNVVTSLTSELATMNGTLVKNTLELFKCQHIHAEQVENEIAALLANKNRFIAKEAFNHLNSFENLSERTRKKMKKYRRKNDEVK